MSTVQFLSPILSAPSYNEIARYMRADVTDNNTISLIDQCLKECEGNISCKVIYSEYEINFSNNTIDLGFAKTESKDLKKLLFNKCDSIILFAATLGIGIDRVLLKYSRLSPAHALCLQAIGAERTEALCDAFSLEMKEKFASQGLALTPRFSPGYGDLPLSLQKNIFSALNCEKQIGLTLNDSLLMSPTKSVTAIIGIKNQ